MSHSGKWSLGLIVTTIALALYFGACSSLPSDDEEHTYEKDEGVVYSEVDGTSLKLDIAWPTAQKGPFPAIIFLHKGGWSDGDRSIVPISTRDATQRGYVVASADYRLVYRDSNQFPAAIEDVKCAVRWLRANADKYNIDPDRIGAAGSSSGAHLALLLGVTDSADGFDGDREYLDYSSSVQAVVNLGGPPDLASSYGDVSSFRGMISLFLGGVPEDVPATYRDASPVTYLDAKDPPMLTFLGTNDFLVPVQHIASFDAKARAIGASHTAAFYEGGHADPPLDLLNEVMYGFFDTHL